MCLSKLCLKRPCCVCFRSRGMLPGDHEGKEANPVSCRIRDPMEENGGAPANSRRHCQTSMGSSLSPSRLAAVLDEQSHMSNLKQNQWNSPENTLNCEKKYTAHTLNHLLCNNRSQKFQLLQDVSTCTYQSTSNFTSPQLNASPSPSGIHTHPWFPTPSQVRYPSKSSPSSTGYYKRSHLPLALRHALYLHVTPCILSS